MSIIRLWNGWTSPALAADYLDLLRTEVVPGIMARDLPGLASVAILRDHDPHAGDDTGTATGEVGFVTAMRFDDWASVAAFAGGDGRRSVVPPAARALLSRHDEASRHLDLIEVQRRRTGSSGPAVGTAPG